MPLIAGNGPVADEYRGGVIAVGNFDGMHRGHQKVLALAAEQAKTLSAPLGVMTFEPHPRTFFRPDQPLFRLTPLDLKSDLMHAAGADYVFALDFNADLAGQEAEDFIRSELHKRLGARHVVTGYDFHFGKGRKGSPDLIASMGTDLGFGATVVEQVTDDDGLAPFSSSAIREALRRGEVRQAAEQLGYWWCVRGPVVKGDQRGRTIGFPTVNIEMNNDGHPANGIYACRVRCTETGQTWNGAGYVGDRPTFDRKGVVLEVHLLDFEGDLYGRNLSVQFNGYIRPDHRYEGVEKLVAQMTADCEQISAQLAGLEAHDPIAAFPLGTAQAAGAV
ncbi:MAG: bifunctional riboflavin kinase/FAD synthetase [Rhizobiales bacterium]|nr:bifunctional riboflavin kinase/FAD synthetase [Hyphomicrobiales bacterium]